MFLNLTKITQDFTTGQKLTNLYPEMSSTMSTSITASPTTGPITGSPSPSSGIGTATPTTAMTMTTSNSGGALSTLEQEIFALKTQLDAVSMEKNILQETLRNIQGQNASPGSENIENESLAYEARLTELHSVIAELKKQLDIRREQIIPEESTDLEDDYELDAEDILSIDEHPMSVEEKALRIDFINAKSRIPRMGTRGNENFHRSNLCRSQHRHHINSNDNQILLTTPSDEDDDEELDSSSGLADSASPGNNPGNNLPSDVDVDGDYFEDDQIITEGFGLKCIELNNVTKGIDVIDTEWIDGKNSSLAASKAADSSNCNVERCENSVNHDSTTSCSFVLSTEKDEKYPQDKRTHDVSKLYKPKSMDFSPLSSPESPEDNNECFTQPYFVSTKAGETGSEGFLGENEPTERMVSIEESKCDYGSSPTCDIHGGLDGNGDGHEPRKIGVFVDYNEEPASSQRKFSEKQQNEQNPLRQHPSPQQRRQVRKHRRGNGANNGRRNRDNNYICQQVKTDLIPPIAFASSIATTHVTTASGRALEIQEREKVHNPRLGESNEYHPSSRDVTAAGCGKREEFPIREPGRLQQTTTFAGGGLGNRSTKPTRSESPCFGSKPPVQFALLRQEVAQIQQEHAAIKDNLYKKEGELDFTRNALENIARERDFLKNKVSELEHLLKQSPKRLSHLTPSDLSFIPVDESAPMCKVAERVKLRQQVDMLSMHKHNHFSSQKSPSHAKGQSPFGKMMGVAPEPHITGKESSPSPELHKHPKHQHNHQSKHNNNGTTNNSHFHNNRHHSKSQHPHPPHHSDPLQHHQQHYGLTGADLMLIGQACSTRVVEHLVQPIKNESALREFQHSCQTGQFDEEKLREFEIETERLNSRIENLRCQNDVLSLNLEDAKSQADRLTVLLGKYESNNVALQLAVGYSDHTIEAYDILVALLESELGQLLANLRATGIGANSPPYHHTTDSRVITPVSGSTAAKTTTLSSPHLNPRQLPCSASCGNVSEQSQFPSEIPTSTSSLTCQGSGNNNNSNDNSPTEVPQRIPLSYKHSDDNNTSKSVPHRHPVPSPPGTTFILSTTSTTVTTTSASLPAFSEQEEGEIRALIEKANENRLTAENAAHVFLSRITLESSERNVATTTGSMIILPGSDHRLHNNDLQRSNDHHDPHPSLPWEETSSCSQTLSSASSVGKGSQCVSKLASHQGGDLMRNEESRIRDLIITLKTERESVKGTVTEMESWSLESLYPSKPPSPCDILEARKLDLETAVLMQELMAMREERAELRAQLFLLEKEKTSLEVRLQSHETQEEAYKARINYLKSEIQDCQNCVSDTLTPGKLQQLGPDGNANGLLSPRHTPGKQTERELVLKKQIKELASALEKVTVNSKLREEQNHEMISELKRANGILIETLEAVKKKYQSRIRRMEEQIISIMERHSMQLKLHKDRIHYLELENKEQRSCYPEHEQTAN